MTTKTLAQLAIDATPRDDDDWGSLRQIEAENRFFAAVRKRMSPNEFMDLESWCLKARTEEMIEEALRRLRVKDQVEFSAFRKQLGR